MTGTDGGTSAARRSVGEHLVEADRGARRLLGDVGRGRAPAMVRMWPVVVDQAAQLWAALPEQGGADSAMDRLWVMAQGLRQTHAGRGWPGAGPDHVGLGRLAASFADATESLRGEPPSSEVLPGRPPELSDLSGGAVRVRVIHTLYVSAHAVGLGVREDRPATARSGSTTGARTASAGEDIAARLLAFEHVAGGYLGHPGRRGPDGQDTPAGGVGACSRVVGRLRSSDADPVPDTGEPVHDRPSSGRPAGGYRHRGSRRRCGGSSRRGRGR